MKIVTRNKSIIKKLKNHDVTYLFNEEDNINELLKLSDICTVKKETKDIYDIAIDCNNITAKRYHSSTDNVKDILKPIEKKDYKFSIIIPNYNYSEWLEKCIGSVLNQTYKNYEIIFIDDNSTDNSVEVAQKLLRKEDTLIRLKMNRLNGGTRNEGLIYIRDNSDSDYVVFLDSDDWLIDNKVLEDYNNALYGQDVLFVGVKRVKNGKSDGIWGMTVYKDKYEAMASGNSGSCFAVIKKELATRPECLFNEGTLMEDRNHHSRICYYMKSFTHLGRVTHIWNRDNTKSVCATRDKARWGTSKYRNYADCLQFKLEIENEGDSKALAVLTKRLKNIKDEFKNDTDKQH